MTTALDLIIKYTPFYPEAKPCITGHYYIGYWFNAYEEGLPVQKGDTITKERAKEVLEYHLSDLELPSGDWNDKQKEALKSLIYYMQYSWEDSPIKKALESGDLKAVRFEWEKIRDGVPYVEGRPWKQDEINLFFGE